MSTEERNPRTHWVYICHCGSNIAGVVNVVRSVNGPEELVDQAWLSRVIINSCAPAGQE